MNAISISNAFSSLMTRYREQLSDLDAAEDEQDIDRLADASHKTLTELCSTRARSITDLADKINALVERFSDYGCVPMEQIRDLLADAQHLAPKPGDVHAVVAAPASAADTTRLSPEWSQALAAWEAAHGEVVRYNASGVPDEVMDQATSNEHDAAYRLAALPAPDRAGVGIKINSLLDYLEGCAIDVPTLRMIAADAIRAGEEVA